VIREEAIRQVEAGADILDINIGVPNLNHPLLMRDAVRTVSETVDAPLCLDSDDAATLEAGLDACPGKPIVNSVRGDESSLQSILPRVKDHGAAVIGLTMDDTGVPKTADQRVAIAHRIVDRAVQLGIPAADVIIDSLALTVATEAGTALETFEAIARIRDELGVNQTLGASNVSYGLPLRGLLTSTFLSIGIYQGLTCPTVDAAKVRSAVLAADLLLGRDDYAMRYIQAYRQQEAESSA
jgi:5-methyltetrahydrofolate--homocysteine methyltransferase